MLSKGFFTYEEPFFSDYFSSTSSPFAMLSGPNFASEISNNVPSITTIASCDEQFLKLLKQVLETQSFEIELSPSVKSIEIYAIFKNIISIQSGYMEKMKLPFNLKSKIITKLVQEMIKFCDIFEKSSSSFFTSAGIGDLFLTCTSSSSRNFRYGYNFDLPPVNEITESGITIEGIRSLSLIPYLEKNIILHFTYIIISIIFYK